MFNEGQTLDNAVSQQLKARDTQNSRERYRLNLINEKEKGFSNINQQKRKFSTKVTQDEQAEVKRANENMKKADKAS